MNMYGECTQAGIHCDENCKLKRKLKVYWLLNRDCRESRAYRGCREGGGPDGPQVLYLIMLQGADSLIVH